MRTLRKNRQTLYYALYGKEISQLDENGDESGDPVIGYHEPVKFYANISPNKGTSYIQPFGNELDYTKTILTAEELPITEGTRIWQETAPPDGENDGTTADYKVVRVAKSLNVTTYALKALVKNGLAEREV